MNEKPEVDKGFIIQSLISQNSHLSYQVAEREAMIEQLNIEAKGLRDQLSSKETKK